MTSPQCAECTNSSHIRVNLSSTQLSEIERTLRSDFGPSVISPERAEELKEILAMADKDIEDHESEVACLRDKLRVVEAQKLQLETQRAKLRSLLSPIRKLPNELLLHILQYVCERNIFQLASDENSCATNSLPTMTISYVCSRWRTLALSSPNLWANIEVEIYVDMFYKGSSPKIWQESEVTRYLARSGDWPLRLSLNVWDVREPTETPSPISIPELFMQQVYRWKTFKYAGPQLEYKTLSPLHFPLLSEVDIGRAVTSSDLDCFEHSPRLCTISSRTIPRSNILCNQIEHLKLHGRRSLAGLAKVLRSCPSLKSLEVTDIQTSGAGLEQGTLGTWRNITSLASMDCSLQKVFSSFNFPSLNKLAIDDRFRCTVWPVDALISFISRSSCVITSLTLYTQSLVDSDLIAVLRVMPDLLHLDIATSCYQKHDSITSHLLSSLTQQQSTSVYLVPKLHSLSLHDESADFDDHAFIRMVESRWFKPGSALSTAMSTMGKACIRSVFLNFARLEVDAEIYEPLRILDAEGLRVVLSGTNGSIWDEW